MRVVIQRVSEASISIDDSEYASIGKGLLILLGIETEDDASDVSWLVRKIVHMRLFGDVEGKINLAVSDIQGECLVVSQFTLHASTKKGNRPSFIKAARPEQAVPLYEAFIYELDALLETRVASGKFGANMKVQLVNDGPVTIIMDSKTRE